MYELTAVVRGYDYLFPLSRGDIAVSDASIVLDHHTSIDSLHGGSPPEAGEMSLSKYLLSIARGDDRWVGLPIYLIRSFRHRTFWVRTGSELRSLSDLRGKRVGISGWSDSGNTWARAALTDAGVSIDDVHWVLGPPYASYPRSILLPTDGLPGGGVRLLPRGQTLPSALVSGDVDAVSLAFVPDELREPGAPYRRLIVDYSAAEKDYLQRTGVYPIFHIMAIRRDVFTARPQWAEDLYRAVAASWRTARALYWTFGDVTPWMLSDLEEADRLLGGGAVPFGLSDGLHRDTLLGMGRAQVNQRLTSKAATLEDAFGEVMGFLNEDADVTAKFL